MAIYLDAKADTVLNFHSDYLRLMRMDGLVKIYNDLKNDFHIFLHLYRSIMKEHLSQQDITTNLVKGQQELKFLEKRVELYINYIRGKQSRIIELKNKINRLKSCR